MKTIDAATAVFALLVCFGASSALAATHMMKATQPAAQSDTVAPSIALYKISCTPGGTKNRHIVLWNTGTEPAPLGLKLHWKMVHPPYRTDEQGSYKLTEPLASLAGVMIPNVRLSKSITCDVPNEIGWDVICVAGIAALLGTCSATVVSH